MQENYYNTPGRIFDIQKFSTHDGPGIRTIVFLKGCVLRCRWCCNPESQNYNIETMNQNGKIKTMGYDTTVREVMDKVIQDMPYYRRSGGGLTLSGGECLVQPDFSAALLRAAKEDYGLTTAIESTACAPYEYIEKLLPYLDWYLMDIKHTDPAKHKAFTGKSNERILDNAKRLARDARHLVVRVPVIPTFNDREEEILSIARFAASLGTVRELHLLPYHRLGYDKYIGLGREYLMGDVPPPTGEKMKILKAVAESTGLEVMIGG
ncbi:MAG: glycyl-radical enzyme activating protein [Eubacteriales bacterium]